MPTRGFYSFNLNGNLKTVYAHADAYPAGLGNDVLAWLRDANLIKAATQVQALTVVTDDTTLPKEVEEQAETVDARNPQAVLDFGYVGDNSRFPLDSLWAEWGYVIDLDTRTFEIHQGFQDRPHKTGRFAADGKADGAHYWPVKLIRSIPLDALPESLTDDEGDLAAADAPQPA